MYILAPASIAWKRSDLTEAGAEIPHLNIKEHSEAHHPLTQGENMSRLSYDKPYLLHQATSEVARQRRTGFLLSERAVYGNRRWQQQEAAKHQLLWSADKQNELAIFSGNAWAWATKAKGLSMEESLANIGFNYASIL